MARVCLPALMMMTFLVGKFRSQTWRLTLLDDDDRNLQQALDANRFAARCAAHRCFPHSVARMSSLTFWAQWHSCETYLWCRKVYMYLLVAVFEVCPAGPLFGPIGCYLDEAF